MLTKESSTGRVQFAGADLSTDFQPVVGLDAGVVLGSEALLRARRNGREVPPLQLLAWAREHYKLTELDLLSLTSAVASANGRGGGVVLVNVEPETLIHHTQAVLDVMDGREPGVHIVIEITERALSANPAGLLKAADTLRSKGHPIAFDDVGADPRSLALLEVVRPGIVKVDVAMLRGGCGGVSVRIADAVAGYAESVGATIVAIGVETDADAMRARALGAHLGQGELWGGAQREWPVQAASSPLRYAPPPLRAPTRTADRPFDIVAAHRPTHEVSGAHLALLADGVRGCSEGHAPTSIVLASQDATVSAEGVSRDGDWAVVVLGAGSAVALVARPNAPEADAEPGYRFTVTRDRATVVAAAASMVRGMSEQQ